MKQADWNPELYLQFKDERTQPSIDLVGRIALAEPAEILDVGCGPGNSTQVLVERWPKAHLTGLDNSPAMIERARADYPEQTWTLGDAARLEGDATYDLVFSNATIQWIPDHETLVPRLMGLARPDGAFAFQLPQFRMMSLGRVIDSVAARPAWRRQTAAAGSLFTYHPAEFYYDLLAPKAKRVVLWQTSYFHIMQSHAAILDWTRGTGLRPYLDRLETDDQKALFESQLLEEIRSVYPAARDGRVLFPFQRLFVIAYR